MSGELATPVTFRPASEPDLEDEWAVFMAAQSELHDRRGAPLPSRPFEPAGMWARVHRHLLEHDAERAFVAEEDGRIVGFTAALRRADCWYFSALFIDPDFQGTGIGRRLLELASHSTCRRRMTITEAIQPVSNGLYSRHGLLPVTPVLAFAGRPRIASGDEALEQGVVTPAALAELDQAAYGFDRRVDHEFWARNCERATVWWREGRPCAYSYRGGFAGLIGPVAGCDPASAAAALRNELADTGDADVVVNIPGSATELARVAIDAGLRLGDPGLLLLAPPDPPPTAYAIHSYWLG